MKNNDKGFLGQLPVGGSGLEPYRWPSGGLVGPSKAAYSHPNKWVSRHF